LGGQLFSESWGESIAIIASCVLHFSERSDLFEGLSKVITSIIIYIAMSDGVAVSIFIDNFIDAGEEFFDKIKQPNAIF